mgnify:CR=1 FL=1
MSITDIRSLRNTAADHGDPVQRAREIAPVVDRYSADTEAGRNIAPEVAAAFTESELSWMLVPEELGGLGASAEDFILVIEEVSRADTSSGWSLMANAGGTALAAGFSNEAGVRKLFDGGQRAIVAGLFAPMGTATTSSGALHGRGRYQFGSGTAQATHIAGGVRLLNADGSALLDAGGHPITRSLFVPRESVEFLDGWHVMGLKGTGSYDYAFPEQEFDPDLSIPFPSVTPLRGRGFYSIGMKGIAAIGHAGVVLGAMKRALEEVARAVDGKRRQGYSSPVGEHVLFLDQFSRHDAIYQAARSFVLRTMQEVDANEPESEATPLQLARIRQAVSWAHDAAQQVIPFAHLWTGTAAFREPTLVGRITRDLFVATQHVMVDPITYSLNAPVLVAAYRAGRG